MLSQYPRVGCLVVTQQWLLPVKEARFCFPPCRMIIVLHGFRVLAYNLGNVFYRSGSIIFSLVPGPIEHGDKLLPFVSGIGVCSDTSAKSIGSRPLVAVYLLCRDGKSCSRNQEKSE